MEESISKTIKVAAVVVTYNRLPKLKKCVESLLASSLSADVLVVDNASTDGTSDWLSSVPGVSFRNTGSNIGGAGGFSFGVNWALSEGYDYVWLMDDDCFVRPDSLSELMAADRILGGNYGWLSSVALWKDGSPCLMNKQKVHEDFYLDAEKLHSGLLRASQATFVSLFLRADVIRQVGLPIADFFIWGDDVEFTRRIAVRSNMRSYVVGRSLVDHDMASNNGSSIATDVPERIDRYFYAYRNEAYLFRQEGFSGVLYFVAKCFYNLWRIVRLAPGQRLRRAWVLISSAFRGFFFNPKVVVVK